MNYRKLMFKDIMQSNILYYDKVEGLLIYIFDTN